MSLSSEPSYHNRTADTLVHFIDQDMLVANHAVIVDYGLANRQQYEAIFHAVRAGDITADDLHNVAGDGPGLTNLLRSAPNNPHKDITFKTMWDDLVEPDGEDLGDDRSHA